MFSSEAWLSNSSGFYNGVATQSLRFDRGSSPHLARTPSSAGNRKTWTASFWVKRANFNTSESQNIFMGASDNVGYTDTTLFFDTNTEFGFYDRVGGYVTTSRKFRDPSAWYHIVVVLDTTQSTASDRLKIYVNGSQETSLTNSTYPAQDSQKSINNNVLHWFGGRNYSPAYNYLGAYLAEFNLIDGTALTPSSFGETKNGVWIPKEYTGSYGTNGFRLQFNQTGTGTASTSTIGADTSGNTNHWTSTNIVASDCAMPDSPENNFCTMNPLHFRASYGMPTMSQGNLAYGDTGLSSSFGVAFSTFNLTSGKWYAEILTKGNTSCTVGVVNVGHYGYQKFLVQNPQNETGFWTLLMDGTNTTSRLNGSLADPTYTAFNNDAVLGIALNADDKELSFYVDGTLQTGLGSSGVIDISTGGSANDAWSFHAGTFNGSGVTFVWNFGQDSSFVGDETATSNADANGNGTFHTTVPSGFLAVCTANLPEPTIGPNSATQADDYFNTVTYTGNGGTLAVDGFGHQPDLLWIKSRNITGNHRWTDSSRGVTNNIISNATDAEKGSSDAEDIDSFDTDGFTVTQASYDDFNDASDTYVAWSWKANGGTTSSNSDGSITSTVQANVDAGFSIVTYTGTGANATVGHGLSKAPDFMVAKSRSATGNWYSYQGDGTKTMLLNSTAAQFSTGDKWNNTDTTATVFSLGTEANINGNGNNHIAYCFHSVEGYSKFGSYTGNGSTDGTFVYTGFRPAFLIYKKTSDTGNWGMLDNTRSTFNLTQAWVASNLSNAETNESARAVDFLSNGFKARGTNADLNTSGGTYIYMAFAENPFKYANAR